MLKQVFLMPLVLLIFLFAFSCQVFAEQKYFTWVDAQGNVHSSPLPESADTNKAGAEQEQFLTEEEFNKEAERKRRENPEFFTWTDAEGRIVNSVKPDVLVEFSEQEVVADFVFAPPFRLPEVITQGQCCKQYEQGFSAENSALQSINQSSLFYKTQQGQYPAGYFELDIGSGWFAIKLFDLKDDSNIDLVVLNDEFQPLYLASQLIPLKVKETWSHHGYHKLILELNDSQVRYLILFSEQQGDQPFKVSVKYDLNDL